MKMIEGSLTGFIPIAGNIYVLYKRKMLHETRVVVEKALINFNLSMFHTVDFDEKHVWLCIPPGVCVACSLFQCWFHKLDEQTTYDDLLYKLGQELDVGALTLVEFYAKMEMFTHVKRFRENQGLVHMRGEYPHESLRSVEECKKPYTFLYHILPRAPKGLVRALVDIGCMPIFDDLPEYEKDDMIRIACENPDPNDSVLQFLYERGLIHISSDMNLLKHVRTSNTMKFILTLEIHIGPMEIDKQLNSAYIAGNEKAGIMEELCKRGYTNFPLTEYSFIDLDTLKVVERYRTFEEVHEWLTSSYYSLCIDRMFYKEVWPYIFQKYHLQFTPEVFILAVSYTEGPGDLDTDDLEDPNFVLTYPDLLGKMSNEDKHAEYVLSRLGILLSYNRSECPFKISPKLQALDKHMVWNPYTIRYFSYTLRLRVYTLLLVFRRMHGSTSFLKPLLCKIVSTLAKYSVQIIENESMCLAQ